MKQLTILQESLVDGLRGLYEVECKLSGPVDYIVHSTEKQDLKAEFVVYLTNLRKNIKEIEHIFHLMKERLLSRESKPPARPDTSLFVGKEIFAGESTLNWITPLQCIIQYKMMLYKDVYGLAIKLDQPRIACILHEIFEFEKDSQVIFNEIIGHQVDAN